jgi:multidrug efflux system outer membrane protein
VERQAAQLQGQRLLTSVFLVKALGGDWCEAGDAAAGCRLQGMVGVAKNQ